MARWMIEKETWIKTLTYCCMHLAVAVLVAYAISRDWKIALSIGIIEPLVQTFCFHFHERGWKKLARNVVHT